jgi:hypothetical protein
MTARKGREKKREAARVLIPPTVSQAKRAR